ncbi:uncharacterized protein LOC129884374 [Solanum dulcamara]|uniref:uncharacterized protein LOC129884374 n=1 Tax=Solanum dulcamara TaxID=45834 RepID=UPI002484F5AF|nr:uncharacterized protein LOC129884374 [Solanum dulcamara]
MKSPVMTGPTGSSTVHRRQPLLRTETTTPTTMMNHCETLRKRKSEVAGRTAAECATVCCCLPCAMMHFLILAAYKVPTGLCRKMLRKNKQKKLLNNNNKKNESKCCQANAAGDVKESENVDVVFVAGGGGEPISAGSETEMWGRFYEGGFWRNPSQ